ncbi:hypothetical protein [Vibrio gallaecicus]|uniref:hypothetical protein n=1 Tax=Vibrio gallaecicus TaxID=552386 RepID=UPI0025B4BC54|nr:hypothetical protein [Vibrio gallaecicus]MDN3614677.1 hypothetical protein [Vibrio gallaecicus]MDN3615714.1 hypothetical protein [Vibrio gallaecicus]MDN3615753.1 hypothetical protein [Vibrio gallaecicus]MDN3615888.1 hypothetical protein [Vibrio gallaecicus]
MNGTSVNLPFHTLSNSLDVHLVIALTQFCPNFPRNSSNYVYRPDNQQHIQPQ